MTGGSSLAGLSCSPATPTGRAGAIAIIDIWADAALALDAGARELFGKHVPVGSLALADLLAIDRGLIARPSGTLLQLMPHGGPAVVRALLDALGSRGVVLASEPDPRIVYPEAASEIEAHMLRALSRSGSPLAATLLLAQPARWARGRGEPFDADDAALRRLIDPPTVVAVGPPNVGKSTLLNALAGTDVALTADAPGTTRDHVGAHVLVDGLAVRWLDAPGYRNLAGGQSAFERSAIELVEPVLDAADLIVLIADPLSDFRGDLEPVRQWLGERAAGALTICARSDLGEPRFEADCAISVANGSGVDHLCRLIRERLVPDRLLESDRPWRFWGEDSP